MEFLELDTRNYYTLLGIDAETADDSIVLKSYRRVAMLVHPDRNPEHADRATELFKMLTLAYDALKTADNRALYTQALRQQSPFRSRKTENTYAQPTAGTDINALNRIRELEDELTQYAANYKKSEEQAAYLRKIKEDELGQKKEQLMAKFQKNNAAMSDAIRQYEKWFGIDTELRNSLKTSQFADPSDKRVVVQKIKDSTAATNTWADAATKLQDVIDNLKIAIKDTTKEHTAYIASLDSAKALRYQEYCILVASKQAEIQELKNKTEKRDNANANTYSTRRSTPTR